MRMGVSVYACASVRPQLHTLASFHGTNTQVHTTTRMHGSVRVTVHTHAHECTHTLKQAGTMAHKRT